MPKLKDITGQRFGRWTVLRLASTSPTIWECRCDCGSVASRFGSSLKNGASRSCGCYKDERTGDRSRTHGRTRTPEYRAWAHAKDRCHRPSDAKYHIYGARGITMCDRWRHDFAAFYADMGPRPAGCTLERNDSDGPYSPDNCRWATRREQANNTCTNRIIEARGERRTLAEWGRHSGIRASAIAKRLQRGWTPEEALTTPLR